MSAELITIQPEQIPQLWEHIRPKLEKALVDGAAWTPLDVAGEAIDGRVQLWGTWKNGNILSIWVTSIAVYHRSKVCDILACGGEGIEDIIRHLPKVEAWAAEQGCSAVRIMGRKGWERMLNNYNKTAIVLEKSL